MGDWVRGGVNRGWGWGVGRRKGTWFLAGGRGGGGMIVAGGTLGNLLRRGLYSRGRV